MIRGLLSSALRAATALKLTPKKYFVFFWGPRGGRQGWDRTPKRFAKQKDLREFSGFPKIFFAEKDFWEKEEQALKTWCLPSGKYPKRAPLNGVPAKIFAKQKDLWGKERRALKAWRLTLVNCSPNAPRGIFRAPAKIFAKQKDLWGKGGTDVISVAFAFRRMPAKGVVFRRGAADRPRTDTPSGTGS